MDPQPEKERKGKKIKVIKGSLPIYPSTALATCQGTVLDAGAMGYMAVVRRKALMPSTLVEPDIQMHPVFVHMQQLLDTDLLHSWPLFYIISQLSPGARLGVDPEGSGS